MTHKLISASPKLIEEDYSSVNNRYKGYGSNLFEIMRREFSSLSPSFRYFHYPEYNTKDVISIRKMGNREFGIQLDPDCEVICFWDNDVQSELGTWFDDVYEESIKFIKENFV